MTKEDRQAVAIKELRKRIDQALKEVSQHAIDNRGDYAAQADANRVRESLGYSHVKWKGEDTGELPEYRHIYSPCACGATSSDCDFVVEVMPLPSQVRCRFCGDSRDAC